MICGGSAGALKGLIPSTVLSVAIANANANVIANSGLIAVPNSEFGV